MTAPGWYLDPVDPAVEQYWTGSEWQPGARVASPDTPAFPGGPPAALDPEKLTRRALNAAERTATYLGWILALQVVMIMAGGVAVLVALNR